MDKLLSIFKTYKKTSLIVAIWLLFGLYITFENTAFETRMFFSESGFETLRMRRTWIDNIPGFIIMFLIPSLIVLGVLWRLLNSKEKQEFEEIK